MRLKIRGGTVQHGQPSLCLTCRSATVVTGPRLRDEIVECSRLGGRVTFPVSSCNGYIDRTHPTIREMEEIAWVLRSDPRRNQIGFVQARKLKPQDRYVIPDEWDSSEECLRVLRALRWLGARNFELQIGLIMVNIRLIFR